MFSDTVELQPPSPAFREENAGPSTTRKYSLGGDGINLPAKRKVPSRSRLNVSITSVLSFHSKSSRPAVPEADDGSKSFVTGSPYSRNSEVFGGSTPSFHPNGSSPLSSTSLSSETKSFLHRVSAAFRRPSLATREEPVVATPDAPRPRPANGLTLVIPKSRVAMALSTSPPTTKEDYFTQHTHTEAVERKRFRNFRFGRAANNAYLGLDDALPSPSDGLFESSMPGSWMTPSSSLTITPESHTPVPIVSDHHIFPMPAALTPLLSPVILEPNVEPAGRPTISSPPAPQAKIPPLRERANRLTLIPVGVRSPDIEEALLSPSLTRSRSPSMSDDDSTVSTPTLLESALCLSGCTLKSSTSPKTWAANDCIHRVSVIVERPIEKGVWGLTDLPADQIVVPLSASIIFDEELEMVTSDTDDSHDELPMRLVDIQRRVSFADRSVISCRPSLITRRARSLTVSVYRPEATRGPSRRTLSLTMHDHTSRLRRMKALEADGSRSVTLIHTIT
ncbi:hypothetical protein PM082_006817 [Marasmius tenuissimus]|nr:hypothetical protein PM082_006817 [Marasmius tenuissimus]